MGCGAEIKFPSGGTAQDLQGVTDIGNATTNNGTFGSASAGSGVMNIIAADALNSNRALNVTNPSQLLFGVTNGGRFGVGTQPNPAASGGAWMNIETTTDPTVGIDYNFKSANTGTKTVFQISSDNSTAASSITFLNITDSRNNGNKNKGGIGINLTAGGGTGIMKAIQVSNGICLFRNIETQLTDTIGIGANNSNNSWRFMESGGDLVVQKRILGTWTTKGTFTG